MAKKDKLIKRFKTLPSDFHWSELVTLMRQIGFKVLQGSGSRVKFYNEKIDRIIQLHKPHPEKIIKKYMLREILAVLKKEELI